MIKIPILGWMRSSQAWMGSTREVKAFDWQGKRCCSPGFNPTISSEKVESEVRQIKLVSNKVLQK
jgi:hypothetical protein